MRAEFATLDRVTPQLAQRTGVRFEACGKLGLAARHQGDESRFMAQGEQNGFVRRRVAGMERCDDIGAAARQCRVGDGAFYELNSLEIAFGGDPSRRLDQIPARFDAIDQPAALPCEVEIVENETKIGLPRTKICQNWLLFFGE